jgi:steroid delta-isomerase-like uncharacterized protein
MSEKQLRALINHYVEDGCNSGNFDVMDDIFAKDCTLYHPSVPQPMHGVEALKGFMSTVVGAFPDFHVTVHDQLVAGDKVVNRGTVSGTFKHEFAGIPATGKHAEWTVIAIYRFAGGKVVEIWEELDLLGAWQRLGVIPTPA